MKAFRPVLVLKQCAWRAVLDGRRRGLAATEDANRVRGQEPLSVVHFVRSIGELCGLTFELSGRQRQDARPGLAKMYRVPLDRAWWPAVGAPLERVVRPRRGHCSGFAIHLGEALGFLLCHQLRSSDCLQEHSLRPLRSWLPLG